MLLWDIFRLSLFEHWAVERSLHVSRLWSLHYWCRPWWGYAGHKLQLKKSEGGVNSGWTCRKFSSRQQRRGAFLAFSLTQRELRDNLILVTWQVHQCILMSLGPRVRLRWLNLANGPEKFKTVCFIYSRSWTPLSFFSGYMKKKKIKSPSEASLISEIYKNI